MTGTDTLWVPSSLDDTALIEQDLLTPATAASSSRRPRVDDWEDDDDDADENGADNQQIWHNANTRAPMPHLIASPAAAAPPAAALQPAMRILKRPSATATSPSLPPVGPGETLREREARYRAARDRIFGDGADRGSDKKGVGVGVMRNPKGPAPAAEEGEADGPPKGFGARRTGKAKPERDSEEVAS
ncbi:hypothetical protein B0H12DRAFT_1240505 [Mycena haematopus]|nr:hypothetical protein B0H12DRAFT_1240505 [Mycena haematopus]